MISFPDNINRKEEWTALIKLELGSTFLLRRPISKQWTAKLSAAKEVGEKEQGVQMLCSLKKEYVCAGKLACRPLSRTFFDIKILL